MTTHQTDILTEAAKAAPAVTVGGLTLFGVGLADWVLLVTLIYTLLQLGFLVRDKWYNPRKARNGCKR
jgi:predicted benzoate:H+ symporter BenE